MWARLSRVTAMGIFMRHEELQPALLVLRGAPLEDAGQLGPRGIEDAPFGKEGSIPLAILCLRHRDCPEIAEAGEQVSSNLRCGMHLEQRLRSHPIKPSVIDDKDQRQKHKQCRPGRRINNISGPHRVKGLQELGKPETVVSKARFDVEVELWCHQRHANGRIDQRQDGQHQHQRAGKAQQDEGSRAANTAPRQHEAVNGAGMRAPAL